MTALFEIVNAERLKGASSPHTVLAYAEDTNAAFTGIGYVLASLDLTLQAVGYGSIIMGMAKPRQPALDYRILLAFGKTDVPIREHESDFKRKSVLDISNENNNIARAARLAPSAVNFQPWKLHFTRGNVTIYYTPKGIGKLLAGKMQMIDMGIITRFLVLALEPRWENHHGDYTNRHRQELLLRHLLPVMHLFLLM